MTECQKKLIGKFTNFFNQFIVTIEIFFSLVNNYYQPRKMLILKSMNNIGQKNLQYQFEVV